MPNPSKTMDGSQVEDDLSHRFKSFTLTDVEQDDVILSQDDVVESEAECRSSLFGKVISQKPANLFGIKNTMEKVWGNPKNFRVLAVGDGIFQFVFPSELAATRVLRGKPWFFNNHFLVLERWKPDIPPKDYCFNFTPMWIQVWGIPLQFLSKDVGVKIGLKFGDVDDVVIPHSGSREGRFLRIRTVVDVTQPLKRGCMIRFPNAKPTWIEFRYERLPMFCRYCGNVGHELLTCDKRFLDMEDEVFLPAEYGDWLRASPATQQGRRHESPTSEGRRSTADSVSGSGESLAENQGSDSRKGVSNSKNCGNPISADLNGVSKNDAHAEMVTEAYLAERSKDCGTSNFESLEGNNLTPFQERILNQYAKPILSPSTHINPAQSLSPTLTQDLSSPSDPSKPSPSSINPKPNIILAGPTSSSSITTIHPISPYQSLLNNPTTDIPQATISPITSSSPSFTLSPSISQNLTFTNSECSLTPKNASLIDIPILVDSPKTKLPRKRNSSAVVSNRGRSGAAGRGRGNRQHPTPPLPSIKSTLNPNGKRCHDPTETSQTEPVLSSPTTPTVPNKKARVTGDRGAAPHDSSCDMVAETSPKWSPATQ